LQVAFQQDGSDHEHIACTTQKTPLRLPKLKSTTTDTNVR
jgi:hypothetical protein